MDEKSINILLEANYQKGVYEGMLRAFSMIKEKADVEESGSESENRGSEALDNSEQEQGD